MIRKAFKYRIYPNAEQRELLAKHFGCARWIYNWAIDREKEAYENDEGFLSAYDLHKEITQLKRQEETKWLAEPAVAALQAAAANATTAFKNFFQGRGYPRYKSKHDDQSYQVPRGAKADFDEGRIKMPKIPWMKARLHRRFHGTIKTTTVSMNRAGRYYISFLVEMDGEHPEKPPVTPETTVGIDLGISHFATFSDGEKIENPRFLQKSLARLKVLQRRLSRKQKGSNNRRKAREKVARQHAKIRNQRKDFLHKLTARLTGENQTVAIETLNVSGMMKNRSLSRAIADVGWHEFKRQLEYKSEWYGVNLKFISQWEPSTRRCTCGHVNKDLTLSDRSWDCPACGEHIADRDVHAAKNIKQIALADAGVSWDRKNTRTLRGRACGDAASFPSEQLSLFVRGKPVEEAGTAHAMEPAAA